MTPFLNNISSHVSIITEGNAIAVRDDIYESNKEYIISIHMARTITITKKMIDSIIYKVCKYSPLVYKWNNELEFTAESIGNDSFIDIHYKFK